MAVAAGGSGGADGADGAGPERVAGIRTLLAANLATWLAALVFDWSAGSLLWPYLAHSVLIGWYARRRMLGLRDFDTGGMKSNGEPVPATPAGARSAANFFAVHYGFFHVGYAIFVASLAGLPSAIDWLVIAALVVSFASSARAAFRAEAEADRVRRPHLGKIMFLPYLRVLPMHLTIILGGVFLMNDTGNAIVVTLFVALKTAADVAMHVVEDRLRRPAAARTGAF